ncbi:EF-hand domain-containing protein [Yinghuangia seranimata]|uniref:EF-hand domain-containing protein n=1 Tax=Yinghuangia seranimata TaxID=408067 RepID=UPI00248C0242|nr:EF-hand domain-containing protein [Yinghuangia seranimata]MDI2125386.1 EF-hand domain-containing protein [Yinghuangia seranimata]
MTAVPGDFHRFQSVFESVDRDHDGYITAAELLTALDRLGRPAPSGGAEELMRAYDADHSGNIDFEEFTALLAGSPDAAAGRPQSREHTAGTHRG